MTGRRDLTGIPALEGAKTARELELERRVEVLEAIARPSALAVRVELRPLVDELADRLKAIEGALALTRTALELCTNGLLRQSYAKDLRDVAELEAVADAEWAELERLLAEREQ